MTIAALQRFTLSDFPGAPAAIVFFQGCDFRCPYCHNPELLPMDIEAPLNPAAVLDFLRARQGQLDGVVFSGGEPTSFDRELIQLAKEIKSIGFRLKLDTNGGRPDVIETLLAEGLLDYIAMDIKGPLEKYPVVAGITIDAARIAASVALVKSGAVAYEFRTTIASPLLVLEDMEPIGRLIAGARLYILQPYTPPPKPVPGAIHLEPPSEPLLRAMRDAIAPVVERCQIRSS